MSHADWLIRQGQKSLNDLQTHVAYCDKCGQCNHTLPMMGGDMGEGQFFIHANCGGWVHASHTTTHDMFDHLTRQQRATLQQEISEAVCERATFCKRLDDYLLKDIQHEKYRVRHNLPEYIWKRNLREAEFLSGITMPRCPECNSLLVDKIHLGTRLSHFFFRDPPESLQGKTMECLECWHRW